MASKVLKILFFTLTASSMLLAACASQPASPATEAPGSTEAAPAEPTAAPELTHLTVSILPFLSYAPFFIAQEEGYFTEQGLEVEFVRIDKTSDAMPALAQGQIDVAAGFFDVSTLNAIAQGGNIRYVSDKGYLAPQECSASCWVLSKALVESGELDDLNNIAGKKVAYTPTSSAEYAMDVLLKGTGLSSADVETLNIPLPTRLESLGNGSIDLAAVSDPWTIRMVNAGYGEVWHPWEEVLPNFQFSVIMYGPNLLEKNRDAGNRFIMAYLKAVKQYHEGKTDRNVEIIAKYTEMKPEEVKQSCWMIMKDDGMLDLSGMAGFQQWAVDKGYQTEIIPDEQLVDLSFIEYAKEAMK
jgi:NitT/TauT family transport system substrate-binding protein